MITGVPTALTSFVGRHDELQAAQRLLAERRLVTLTGIGGGLIRTARAGYRPAG